MTDEHPDDSPWTRDDWVPDSAVPSADVFDAPGGRRTRSDRVATPDGLTTAPGGDGGDAEPTTSRPSIGRTVVAGAVVAALLIGSAGALLRAGDDPTATPSTSENADPSTSTTLDTAPVTSRAPDVTLPAATVGPAEMPARIASLVVGQPPAWTERAITVPQNLASMAATEVVTLSQDGIVSVTEFPSGRTRSIDASTVGAQLQIAVGDRTIVVFDSTTLVQIRDGEPIVESTLSDGIIFVQPWTATGNFVVTTPSTGPETPERDWVLRPDGALEPLDNPFAEESAFFSRVFSPAGEALVSAPGGVYAVDADGDARRISTGRLIATGRRHWAIEECDETLRCAYSIIEWETGAVTPGLLDAVAGFGFIDPATHISPDGRSIAFRGDTDGSGRREILDVVSGNSIPAGRMNQLVYPDAWATDSSGLFTTDRFLQFVDRATGTITEIEGLGPIRTVAAEPFSG